MARQSPQPPALTYDNLTRPCAATGCLDGQIASPRWTSWWAAEQERRTAWDGAHPGQGWVTSPDYQDLLETRPEESPESDCGECHGTGRVPNDAGAAILQLITCYGDQPPASEPADANGPDGGT